MAEANQRSRVVGIGQHSYTQAWTPNSGATFHNALTFLEYAHSIGAAGVQVAIKPEEQAEAGKIRKRAEELGVYFEGNVVLPKSDAELEEFESHIRAVREAGGDVVRTACLSGRRYEMFKSLAEFQEFRTTSVAAIRRAEPVMRRHKVKLAVENHKDWLTWEHVEILREISSEWIGALLDVGNNWAVLQKTDEVIAALGPFAFSSHLKDMGVQEYADGFLLSEVPLAVGFMDIAAIVRKLREANPKIRLNLEMITRDPLKIPCLREEYYATMPDAGGVRLAETLAMVKMNACPNLPRTTGLSADERWRFEDENVRASLEWAAKNLS